MFGRTKAGINVYVAQKGVLQVCGGTKGALLQCKGNIIV